MRDARVRRLIVALVVAAAALWLGALGGENAGPATDDGIVPTGGPVAPTNADGSGRTGTGDVAPAGDDRAVPADAQPATVTHVVDGDTIRVQIEVGGGPLVVGEHRVRLLEIDSPEMDTGGGAPECGAAEATAFLRARLPRGAAVWLESDREGVDRFGRALRYVWSSDGRLLNRTLVATGNARAELHPPNDRHWDTMAAAQSNAQADGTGIWGSCPRR